MNDSMIAERTEKVYDRIASMEPLPLIDRLKKYYGCGLWAGKLFAMIVGLGYLIWRFLEW
jgi:phosphatidylinositol glycan class A protein